MKKITLSNKTCTKLGFVQEDGRNYDIVELVDSTVSCYTSRWDGLVLNHSTQVDAVLVAATEADFLSVEAALENTSADLRAAKNRYNKYLCELADVEAAQAQYDKALAAYNKF